RVAGNPVHGVRIEEPCLLQQFAKLVGLQTTALAEQGFPKESKVLGRRWNFGIELSRKRLGVQSPVQGNEVADIVIVGVEVGSGLDAIARLARWRDAQFAV